MNPPATCGPHCGILGCALCRERSWEERNPTRAREFAESRGRAEEVARARPCLTPERIDAAIRRGAAGAADLAVSMRGLFGEESVEDAVERVQREACR